MEFGCSGRAVDQDSAPDEMCQEWNPDPQKPSYPLLQYAMARSVSGSGWYSFRQLLMAGNWHTRVATGPRPDWFAGLQFPAAGERASVQLVQRAENSACPALARTGLGP